MTTAPQEQAGAAAKRREAGAGTADGAALGGARPAGAALALLLLVPAPSIGTAMAMWIAPGPLGTAVYGFCKAWLLALPLLWLLLVERGRLSWSPLHRGGLGAGLASGVLIGVIVAGAYFLLVHGRLDPQPLKVIAAANGFDRLPVYLLFAGYITFVNSLLEEYVWRWFVFRKCEALLPSATAVPAAALLFSAHHVIALRAYLDWGPALLAAGGVFIGGVAWSWLYRRYRSIWPGFASHALVDAAVFGIGALLLFG